MGEVSRARDTRLQRDVAVKVVPAAFSSDPERLARFEQELWRDVALKVLPKLFASDPDRLARLSDLLSIATLTTVFDTFGRQANAVRRFAAQALSKGRAFRGPRTCLAPSSVT